MLGRDVHPEHDRLVAVLRPRLAAEAHHAGERPRHERAEDLVRAVGRDALGGRRQRLAALLLVARRERIGMLLQAAQPQLPIGGRVVGREPADRDVR